MPTIDFEKETNNSITTYYSILYYNEHTHILDPRREKLKIYTIVPWEQVKIWNIVGKKYRIISQTYVHLFRWQIPPWFLVPTLRKST